MFGHENVTSFGENGRRCRIGTSTSTADHGRRLRTNREGRIARSQAEAERSKGRSAAREEASPARERRARRGAERVDQDRGQTCPASATRHFTRQSVCANYSIQAAGIETRDKEILFCQPRSRRSNFIRRKELHRSAADTCSGKGERLSFPSRLGDDGELCNFAAVRD